VSIREIACYLSMLEGGKVEDKLEFVFRVYDSDGNEYLDSQVLTCICLPGSVVLYLLVIPF